jgi:hypothetical protein
MSTLEIIHLRSSIEPVEALIDSIRESIWETGHTGKVVTMYRRHGVATDVAIHIRRSGSFADNSSSSLAVRLANALKDFGLVEHSVWEEIGSESPIPRPNHVGDSNEEAP